MMRRTISNLSKEMKISRPTIYKKIAGLGIEKKKEYPQEEYNAVRNALMVMSSIAKQKNADVQDIRKSENKAASQMDTKGVKKKINALSQEEKSTLSQRLENAKQEYTFNRSLTVQFQMEIDTYVAEHKTTTTVTHNGTLSPIPAIANLEKYTRLNIAFSKLINDLESDLDLAIDGGDDPFA